MSNQIYANETQLYDFVQTARRISDGTNTVSIDVSTPAVNKVLTSTSGTNASWQTIGTAMLPDPLVVNFTESQIKRSDTLVTTVNNAIHTISLAEILGGMIIGSAGSDMNWDTDDASVLITDWDASATNCSTYFFLYGSNGRILLTGGTDVTIHGSSETVSDSITRYLVVFGAATVDIYFTGQSQFSVPVFKSTLLQRTYVAGDWTFTGGLGTLVPGAPTTFDYIINNDWCFVNITNPNLSVIVNTINAVQVTIPEGRSAAADVNSVCLTTIAGPADVFAICRVVSALNIIQWRRASGTAWPVGALSLNCSFWFRLL